MKNKHLRRAFYVLFGIAVYVGGHFWIHEKVHSVHGYLVIPVFQPGGDWNVTIENDQKQLMDFSLPDSELANIIASQQDLRPENGRSEVKVTYQKNLWNGIVDPKIHVVRPGWIRRPK